MVFEIAIHLDFGKNKLTSQNSSHAVSSVNTYVASELSTSCIAFVK